MKFLTWIQRIKVLSSTRLIPRRLWLRLLLMHLVPEMQKASGGEDNTAVQLTATTAPTVMDHEESNFFDFLKIP